MMSGSFGKIACLCSLSTDKPTLGPLCWQEGSGGLISLGVLIGVPALKLKEDSALLSPVRRESAAQSHCSAPEESSPGPCHMMGGIHCSMGLIEPSRKMESCS